METDFHTAADRSEDVDLIVVGGGLAGLITANLVAREGRSVIVLERSRTWGGRAATQVKDDIHFNMGAHALYCHGHTFRLLTELQVPFSGRYPNPGRSTVLTHDAEYPTPFTLRSVWTSRFLTLREKWNLTQFFRRLMKIDTTKLASISLSQWIAQQAGHGLLNQFLKTLFRLGTFVADAEQMSAGAAIAQLQVGTSGNVWYVDDGWQSIVEGLKQQAITAGVEFRNSASVESVQTVGGGVAVRLSQGETLRATAAVLAVPPKVAQEMLNLSEESSLARWRAQAHSLNAACLDIALNKLTRPDHRFTLGLDSAVYFSVHSAAAKLSPSGIHTVHLLKYLQDDAPHDAKRVEEELEAVLDRTQPGWRAHVVERRFLPNMVVSYAIPAASTCGLQGRPQVHVDGHPGIYLAGDWVGARGLIADAAAASAEEAAQAILRRLSQFEPVLAGSSNHVAAS